MTAPPLPPRRSTSSTEHNKHSQETAGGDGRSSKSENSRIRNEVVNMYKTFVSEVDPKDVLDLLIQKRIINIERKDEVMSKVTRQDRCRALLDQLFLCSHDEAFLVLRQALAENYHWIVERIDLSKSENKEFFGSGNLELSKKNEVELDEACRRIKELEKELVEYRTKTLRLESELHSLQDLYDEAIKREQRCKVQLAILQDLTNSTNDYDYLLNLPAKEEKQTGECPDILLAPPLPPPRRTTDSTEHNKRLKEMVELRTSCFLLKDREIKCSDLQLENRVGSFKEKELWKGKWKKTTDVCVKKLIGNKRSAAKFFVEAQVLHRLEHPNIVQLIGISSLVRPLHIVTEYLSLGSLRNHLQEDQGDTVDLPLIIDFVRQVADGMCFVAKKGIVHRGLRADSIALASPKSVKISSFDIALDLQDRMKAQEETEETRGPIRWTAPESLEFGRWTSSSDVWSFGILLYEMFTFGEKPYSDKTSNEVVELTRAGYRLPCPKSEKALSCPDTVYLMMVRCWDKDSDARPSFQMLQNFFQQESFQCSEAVILKDTIVSRPQLVTIIKGCTAVRGMALLDGWLYVVRFGSTQVEVYEVRDEFKRSRNSISITSPSEKDKVGLFHRLKSLPNKEHMSSGIQDIASCNRNKRLYLSDWQNTCVHCIDPVRKEVTRSWGVESGKPWGISVTAEGNVVVSCGDSAQLCEYSAEGLLMRTIELKVTDEGPWHGLQLLGVNSWVVCHGGRYIGGGYVCVVDSEGNHIRGYEEIQLQGPSHLAVLSSNHVLVAESSRNRIMLLHPSLRGPVREILNHPDHGVMMPVRIHMCESSGRLVVGLVDGTVLVYQIMKAADERCAAVSN